MRTPWSGSRLAAQAAFIAGRWRTTRSIPKFLLIVFAIFCTVAYYHWMPFAIFTTYLLYGFLRPFLSRKMKQEIEDELEDDEPEETTGI